MGNMFPHYHEHGHILSQSPHTLSCCLKRSPRNAPVPVLRIDSHQLFKKLLYFFFFKHCLLFLKMCTGTSGFGAESHRQGRKVRWKHCVSVLVVKSSLSLFSRPQWSFNHSVAVYGAIYDEYAPIVFYSHTLPSHARDRTTFLVMMAIVLHYSTQSWWQIMC